MEAPSVQQLLDLKILCAKLIVNGTDERLLAAAVTVLQ